MTNDDICLRMGHVIRETLKCGPVVVTRATQAGDVRGWDSLSHTMILLQIENSFGVRLPIERMYEMKNVGELVDVVAHQLAGKGRTT